MISDIRAILAVEKNPNDCAVCPHDVTHMCDMLRYFCVSRTLPPACGGFGGGSDGGFGGGAGVSGGGRGLCGEGEYDEEYCDYFGAYMTGGEAGFGYIEA